MRHLDLGDRPLDEATVNVGCSGNGQVLVLHPLEGDRGEGRVARQDTMEDRIRVADGLKKFAE